PLCPQLPSAPLMTGLWRAPVRERGNASSCRDTSRACPTEYPRHSPANPWHADCKRSPPAPAPAARKEGPPASPVSQETKPQGRTQAAAWPPLCFPLIASGATALTGRRFLPAQAADAAALGQQPPDSVETAASLGAPPPPGVEESPASPAAPPGGTPSAVLCPCHYAPARCGCGRPAAGPP
ncbi:MAG: hypothetical protein JWM59_2952, partial [Verrucomicrobiales bacterium]|nr:hypothetical protein [Verrucomicrobiales bacterium]